MADEERKQANHRFKVSTLKALEVLANYESIARGEKVHVNTIVEEAVDAEVERLRKKHNLR